MVTVRYIVQRFLLFVFVIWAATSVIFFLPRLAPGRDPIRERLAMMAVSGSVMQGAIEEMAKAYIMGHGGSMREPFSTWDRLYHMRHVKPTGTDNNNENHYRWGNKTFSDIVDQMGQLAEDDPKLMDLWLKSLEIWLPELPDVQLVHTVIPVPMNSTYWTNWPSAKDPYVHEGFWHRNAPSWC